MVGARTAFPMRAASWWPNFPGVVLIAAVTFNAVLAIVNAHAVLLSPGTVVAVQSGLTGAAFGYAFLHSRAEMTPWYLLLGLLTLLFLIRSVAMGTLEPKYLGEVAIIPIFVVLGMTCDAQSLDRPILIIFAIVTGVGFIEAFFPALYAELFNIKSYYVQTRRFAEEDFWNAGTTLFVSATRPGERFLNIWDIPRMSSIFLEPVSLGNYITIMAAYFAVRYRELSKCTIILGLIGLAFLLIGCDGRLATVSVILVLIACLLSPYLPRFTQVLYLPAILLMGAALVTATNANPLADDFQGRVAKTFDLLTHYDLSCWLGISADFPSDAMDSGIAYLVATQSLPGTIMLWLFMAGACAQNNKTQIRFAHGLLIYLSLTMMVSYSLVSIKTAALAWFIHGSLQRWQVNCLGKQQAKNSHVRNLFFDRGRAMPVRIPASAL